MSRAASDPRLAVAPSDSAAAPSRAAADAAHAAARTPAAWSAPPDAHPDHHLWRNGRVWWIAFTVHRGHLQDRIRLSLGTRDVEVARRRRDALLDLFAHAEDLKISVRFAPSRRARAREAAAMEAA